MTSTRCQLIATLLLSAVVVVTSRRCCPGDEVFLTVGRACSETRDYRALNCTRGKYLINPSPTNEKYFREIGNDTLDIGQGNVVEGEGYCVTRLVLKDNTTTENDVAFVCFPELGEDDEPHRYRRFHLIGALASISVVFMAAMLFVYSMLPEMRDLEGKCLMSAVFNLGVAFMVLATLQFRGSQLGALACVTTAFLLYFWMLSAFFWLNVVSFNLWRSVVRQHVYYPEDRLFLYYCLYGWGCPLVFLLIALVIHNLPHHLDTLLRPNFGNMACWFDGDLETWAYFYGPIAILIYFNLVYFVWTAWKLWRDCREQSGPKLQSLRFKCVLYTKLFVLMGITWIFELMSHLLDKDNTSYFWLFTDILNALQGVLIFFITVVCRRRVLRGLSQHRTLGFNWPKKWATGVDAESHVILADCDDVEMSPSLGGNGGVKILS